MAAQVVEVLGLGEAIEHRRPATVSVDVLREPTPEILAAAAEVARRAVQFGSKKSSLYLKYLAKGPSMANLRWMFHTALRHYGAALESGVQDQSG